MPLPATSATVIGTIAHSTDDNQNIAQLEAAHFRSDYLEPGPGREVVTAALGLHRQGLKPNLLNVMAAVGARIPKPDWISIVKIWQNGYGDVNPKLAAEAARQDYKLRETSRIHAELGRLMQSQPAEVDAWLPDMQEQLRSLNATGAVYDARPSEIYKDQASEIMFHSTITELDQLIRSYRSGHLIFFCGVSGHGKSTTLYTIICDCVIQGQGVVLVNNENARRKALNRILRGLTHLTEAEIDLRRGHTPERQHVLEAWLKHTDQHLRIYEAQHYRTTEMERIVQNDRPRVLVVDYLRDIAGMVPRQAGANPASAVGDMSYWMLGAANHYGITIASAAQMSDEASKKFQSDNSLVPTLAYGTALPFHACDLWVAVKRDPLVANVSYNRAAKDRATNNLMSEHWLRFNDKTWIYEGSRYAGEPVDDVAN